MTAVEASARFNDAAADACKPDDFSVDNSTLDLTGPG